MNRRNRRRESNLELVGMDPRGIFISADKVYEHVAFVCFSGSIYTPILPKNSDRFSHSAGTGPCTSLKHASGIRQIR